MTGLRTTYPILWRLACCALLAFWAMVNITAYGFHHHHPDEDDCEKEDCPFLPIVLHTPMPAPAEEIHCPIFIAALPLVVKQHIVMAPFSWHFASRAPPACFL